MKYHIIMDDNVVANHHIFNLLRFKMKDNEFKEDLFNKNVKYDENGNYTKVYHGRIMCDGINIYATANKNNRDVIELRVVREER